jgi:serpin B
MLSLVLVLPSAGASSAAAEEPQNPNAAILADAINRSAFSLHEKHGAAPGNLFYSPESTSVALGMVYGGAKGQTGREIASVMGFRDYRPVRPQWMSQAYADHLAALRLATGKGCDLPVANALWGAKGYGWLPDYLAMLRAGFGAGLTELDFGKDAEGARVTINTWVEKETRDKIKDLIPPGTLDQQTRMVLTNAIYFKGKCLAPFLKSDTADADFFLAADRKAAVPMMNQTAHFPYLDGGDFQALQMPYRDGTLATVVLLPKKADGLAAFEKTLSAKAVAEVVGRLKGARVRVTVPKFRMTSAFMLSKTLAVMGMPMAFQPGKADFGGANGGKEPLWIAEVIRRAFVDVYEEGAEAAAATAIIKPPAALAPREEPRVFRADHPFVFLIRDLRSSCILFIGRLADPKALLVAGGPGAPEERA